MNEINIIELTRGRFDGRALIEGRVFEGERFDSFAINPASSSEVVFKNCVFRSCEIGKGTFQLGEHVTLDGVVFEDFVGRLVLDVHSAVNMRATRFAGCTSDSLLWVHDVLQENRALTNQIDLDVADFLGELIIVGNDVSRVRFNERRHLLIHSSLADQSEVPLSRANFFRSSASKAKVAGGGFGVFSIPRAIIDDKEFQARVELFRSRGYVGRATVEG